jgi:hypothetical protein
LTWLPAGFCEITTLIPPNINVQCNRLLGDLSISCADELGLFLPTYGNYLLDSCSDAYPCPFPERCPGGCFDCCSDEKYSGIGCTSCSDGFFSLNNECYPCAGAEIQGILLVLFIFLIFGFMYLLYRYTAMLGASTRGDFPSIRVLPITFTFGQVISLAIRLGLKVPPGLQGVSFFIGASTSVFSIEATGVQCGGQLPYSELFVLRLIFPFSLLAAFALLSLIPLYQKTITWLELIIRLKRGLMLLSLWMFLPFLNVLSEACSCVYLYESEDSLMRYNLSTKCGGESSPYFIIAGILVFFVVVPFLIFVKRKLRKAATAEGETHWAAFLCLNYREECYYWEIVRLGRGCLLVVSLLSPVFFKAIGSGISCAVLAGYGIMVFRFQPHRDTFTNRLDIIVSALCSFIVLCANFDDEALAWIVAVSIVVMFFTLVFLTCREIHDKLGARKRKTAEQSLSPDGDFEDRKSYMMK